MYQRLANQWRILLVTIPVLGALALIWRVRNSALEFGPIWRIDALSAFFAFALFGGIALALAALPVAPAHWWRPAASAIVLGLAYSTTLTPAIVAAYLLFALLTLEPRHEPAPAQASVRLSLRSRVAGLLPLATQAAPSLIAAGCLLIGYGALAWRGASRYNEQTAGAVLDSFVFWFVLLAAVVPLGILAPSPPLPLSPPGRGGNEGGMWLFRFAWLYPLARLYSLGPWNNGWSFATLLLGGGAALWCACSALSQPQSAERGKRMGAIYLALALAGLGLGTSAGIAAGCYGILTYLVLLIANQSGIAVDHSTARSFAPWLLSSALPFTAPFVAAWMLMGAAVAGGVALLAGLAWLVALLHALALAVSGAPADALARRRLRVAGIASIVLGAAAPLVILWLIQPVVAQLQGGLTPYGDINIWPWIGLATSDSAHTQVTTLPSIAIVLLMLVLSALVYVTARLREIRGDETADDSNEDDHGSTMTNGTPTGVGAVLHSLRDEVPWLGGLLGSAPRDQRQPGDSE